MDNPGFKQAMLDWVLENDAEYLDEDDPPVEILNVEYEEGGWTGCETCGEDPDILTVTWRTASGREDGDTFYDLDLATLTRQLWKGINQRTSPHPRNEGRPPLRSPHSRPSSSCASRRTAGNG